MHRTWIGSKPYVDMPRTCMSRYIGQGFLERRMQHGLFHAAQRRQPARDLQVCCGTRSASEVGKAPFYRRKQPELLRARRLDDVHQPAQFLLGALGRGIKGRKQIGTIRRVAQSFAKSE
jgi:hypothetical protein